MMYEEDIEAVEKQFNIVLDKGVKIAKANGINLSKFKREITKGLSTTNDEDQWTFDYQSYLSVLSNGIYESPTEWAKQYYVERWNKK